VIVRILFGLCAALLLGGPAFAQPYPNKPIRVVVGYSAGGGNDLIGRIVAAKLQDKLGQPVVIDNKPGAQSIVACELVAKAAPDGYTLLMAPSGPMTINPAIYAKLPYSPEKDFAPISLLAEFPLLLVVGADQPVKTVRELIEYSRAHPDKANYASSAAPLQLTAELFNQRTGSKFQHIPYKGSGEIVQAVTSGQVLMAFADAAPIAGPLAAGKLRALAVTTAKPDPTYPGVPTLAEAGVPDVVVTLWTGFAAPAGTPPEIIAVLNKAIAEVVAMPEVRTAFKAISVDPRSSTPEAYRALIASDTARWKAVATAANIKLE
jgi:tripartite-type tricarboxylate transporter receptor subunit TctC